jgi:hypothetical protein
VRGTSRAYHLIDRWQVALKLPLLAPGPSVREGGRLFYAPSGAVFNLKGNEMAESAINLTLSQRIRDWFQGSEANLGYRELDAISGEIDATIAAMQGPLTGSAAAWKQWSDFEADTKRNDPGLHQAMDLCSFAEWCADTELGLTSEPFEGVPRLVITSAAFI